jgi:hypothetical protein
MTRILNVISRTLIASTLAVSISTANAQPSIAVLYGTAANNRFGSAMAGGSDFDSDTHPDYVVGSPGYAGSATESGRVTQLAYDGTLIRNLGPASPTARQHYGASVAIVGRIDNDTVDDFVVGAPGDCNYNTVTPFVTAYSGATGSVIWTRSDSGGTEFGSRISVVPDLNSDGIPDVVVGSPAYAVDSSQTTGKCNTGKGQVTVLSGANGNTIWTASGVSYGDRVGSDVAGLPDVTGDGVPDFAALVPGTSAGSSTGVRVYSGQSGSAWKTVSAGYATRVVAFRDYNSDGLTDLLVGAPTASLLNYEGAIKIVSLYGSGSTLATVYGDSAGEGTGFSIATIGDVDNDTIADFVTGALGDLSGTTRGTVNVLSGANLSRIAKFYSDRPQNSYYGYAVCKLGDQNGDGVPDFGIGVPYDSTLYSNGGSIRVVLGSGEDGSCTYYQIANGITVCL